MSPQQLPPGVQRWTGRQVRALRGALRLSKTAFAADLGVSHRTVTNWERDLVTISPFSEGLLDQRLRQADPEQRDRFDALTAAVLIDGRLDASASESEYNSHPGPAHPLLRVERFTAGSDHLETRESDYHHLVKDLIEWASRMRRRDILYWLSSAAAAAAAAPILSELDDDEQHRVVSALVEPERVDDAVIGHIELVLEGCAHQDDKLGPQAALDTVVAQRNLVRTLLPHAPDSVRPRLLSLYADLCGFAGWLSYDLGNYATANDFYETARATAHEAQDRALAALILCNMSQTATWQGHARVGIDHAVAAQGWAAKTGDVRLRAYTYDVAARALALDGQRYAAFDAVRHAQRALDGCRDGDKTRLYFYSPGQLASTESECLLRLGDARLAERTAEQALSAITPSFVRNRAFATLRLGACRLQGPRPDVAGAAEAFAAAAALAAHNRSVRLATQLVDCWRQMEPWHATPEAATLRDQLAASGIL